jgi:archaellum component FlaC
MSFDLKKELDETKKLVKALHDQVAGGFAGLGRGGQYAADGHELVERCETVFSTIPPPEPKPPESRRQIRLRELQLVPAGALIKVLMGLRVVPSAWPRPDVNNKVPAKVRVKRWIQFNNPQLPGSGPLNLDVEVPVNTRAEQVPTPSGDGFVYRLVTETQTVTIPLKAIPPRTPLTPAQASYVQRKKELAAEVHNIDDFIQRIDAEIQKLVERTSAIEDGANTLKGEVAGLPSPVDVVKSLQGIKEQIEGIQQGLPSIEQEANEFADRLKQLEKRVEAVCQEPIP